MGWAQWLVLVLTLVFEFGPKVLALAVEVYRRVEGRGKESAAQLGMTRVSSSVKRRMFAQELRKVMMEAGVDEGKMTAVFDKGGLEKLRVYAWHKENGRSAVAVEKAGA